MKKLLVNFTRHYNKESDLVGFKLLTIGNMYQLEDMYGNVIYIARTNKQKEVQALFLSDKFDNAKTINDIDIIVRKYFKRKIS